jgi:hypothetical protein
VSTPDPSPAALTSGQDSDTPKPPAARRKAEAAALLQVTVSWLERRAAARVIPFTMVGGAYHFTDEHLAEIIRMHEHRPPSAAVPEPDQAPPRRSRRRNGLTPNDEVAMLRARPRPDGPRRRKGTKDNAA